MTRARYSKPEDDGAKRSRRADVTGEFRRAIALDPSDPWLRIEYSFTLMGQDRYEDMLARAREALALCPGYRSGLQAEARALTLLNRQDEAVDVLRAAMADTECAAIALQLADLLNEREAWSAHRS